MYAFASVADRSTQESEYCKHPFRHIRTPCLCVASQAHRVAWMDVVVRAKTRATNDSDDGTLVCVRKYVSKMHDTDIIQKGHVLNTIIYGPVALFQGPFLNYCVFPDKSGPVKNICG